MADAERRRLDREGESLEELARQLRLRLRAGELSEEVVEFCAFLGHEPAQQVLDGPVPVGEFVTWDRWAQALSFEFWLLLLRSRCAQRLRPEAASALAPEDLEDLRALLAWLQEPRDSPPSSRFGGVHNQAATLWAWRSGEGEARPRGSWLRVSRHPLGFDFHPREVAEESVPLLIGQPFVARTSDLSEADYLADRLERGSLDETRLRLAAEAGYGPACAAIEVEALDLEFWLESLRASPRALLHAAWDLLTPVLEALLGGAPESGVWPVGGLVTALRRPGWTQGSPSERRRLQESRARLLAALAAHPETVEPAWEELLSHTLEATRAIQNEDHLELGRQIFASLRALPRESYELAESFARSGVVRLALAPPPKA